MLRRCYRQGVLLFLFISLFSVVNLSRAENDSRKQFSAAQNLAQQGKTDEAIRAYQQIIRNNPQLPEAYNNLAALYLQQNKTAEAKAILEKGLNAHKGYAALYKNLSAINIAMAKKAYSKALQLEVKPKKLVIASMNLKQPAPATTRMKVEAKQGVDNKQVKQQAVKQQANETTAASPQAPQGDSIKNVLSAWSAAWSSQSVDRYLSFYHQAYQPANGISNSDWAKVRRYRITRPNWIKVSLSDIRVEKNTGKQAVVNFKQSYQSNSFNDTSHKQMTLIHTENGWRIFNEKNI